MWSDSDGSLSLRNKPTLLGAGAGGEWWRIGNRQNECELFSQWEFPM
jgi:hypothetical protein